jgi:thioredoxin reductase (NADPH)
MNLPVILTVDDDPQVLAALRRDLKSRYREDYRVLAANSGEAALDVIKELKTRGDALALLISDQRMPAMLGVDLLTRCREIYPMAGRVLLTAYSDVKAAIRGINDARLDHYLEKPWDPPEEHLYPAIDDLLGTWQCEYRPELTGLRLLGHQWSSPTHELKDFLASNLIPYRWLDVQRDPEAKQLMEVAGVTLKELPALVLENGTVLRKPEIRQVAESLGLSVVATRDLYDLIIVGAGPAGLAAAVYGASEGMRTLLLDGHGPGGQAAASSRIENYLGFPAGVSGSELTRRALAQAQRFGAEFLVPVSVSDVCVDQGYKRVMLSDGRELLTRAVIAATGMTYREHPAEGISACTGAGVYYGAAATEALSCRDSRVVIVGGGNSAGTECGVSFAVREGSAYRRAPQRSGRNDVALPDQPDYGNTEYPYPSSHSDRTRRRRWQTRANLSAVARYGIVRRGNRRRGFCFHRHSAAQRLVAAGRASQCQRFRINRT